MKRRNFLVGLGLTTTALAVNTKIKASDEPLEVPMYKGFKLYWSEFVKAPETEKISGYFLAIKQIGKEEHELIGFFSCTGGYSGEYKLGYFMNTCVLKDHKFLTIRSSVQDKEEEMERAYYQLLKEIDNAKN